MSIFSNMGAKLGGLAGKARSAIPSGSGVYGMAAAGMRPSSGVYGMAAAGIGSSIRGRSGVYGMGLAGISSGAKVIGSNAVKGAGIGLGASMLSGGLMEGDQSQLAGIGIGALAGAGLGFARGRNLASRGLAFGRNKAAGLSIAANGTINKGLAGRAGGYAHSIMSNRGITNFASRNGDKAMFALGAGSAGLIGSMALQSNRGY